MIQSFLSPKKCKKLVDINLIKTVSKLLTDNTLNRYRYEVITKPKNSEWRTGIMLVLLMKWITINDVGYKFIVDLLCQRY